jgi:hypothetical protein
VVKINLDKEKEFFKMLYCCGVITKYGIEIMNISDYRINLYIKNGLIRPVIENNVKGYILTSKAKKIIAKRYGLKRSYNYKSIRHCGKLQEIYLNLDLSKYKWITESEIIDLTNEKILSLTNYKEIELYKNIASIDAIIVECETKTAYGIEIISPSYRERDIEKKERLLRLLNIEGIFITC